MTRLQRKVLLCIQDEQDRGRSVSVRDIANALGRKSTGFIHDAMQVLVALGYLAHRPRQARSYKVVRRVEPIVQWFVFDEETKELQPRKEKSIAESRARPA